MDLNLSPKSASRSDSLVEAMPSIAESGKLIRARLENITENDPALVLTSNSGAELYPGSTIALPQTTQQFNRDLELLNERIAAAEKAVQILELREQPQIKSRDFLAISKWLWRGVKEEGDSFWFALVGGLATSFVAAGAIGAACGSIGGGLVAGVVINLLSFLTSAGASPASYFFPYVHTVFVTPITFAADLAVNLFWQWPKILLRSADTKLNQLTEGQLVHQARDDRANIDRSSLPPGDKNKISSERARTYRMLIRNLEEARRVLVEYGQKKFKEHPESDIGRTYDSADELKAAFLPLESVIVVSPRSLLNTIINSPDSAAVSREILLYLGNNLNQIIDGECVTMPGSGEFQAVLNGFVSQLVTLEKSSRREKLLELINFIEALGEMGSI